MHTLAKVSATAFLVAALPALAHHSNSAYKVDQIITLTGTVKEWRWMNPHTWLYLTVVGADGKPQEWAVEGRPPGILGRAGWTSTILQPGERVTVHASPSKNGDPVGIIARVTKADGTVLGNAPNYNREAAALAAPAAPSAPAAGARPSLAGVYYPAQQGGAPPPPPARRPAAAAHALLANGRRLARPRARCAEAHARVPREVELDRGLAHQRLVRVRQHRELPAARHARDDEHGLRHGDHAGRAEDHVLQRASGRAASCLPRRPQAVGRGARGPDVRRLLDGPLGRRHARRRHRGAQRQVVHRRLVTAQQQNDRARAYPPRRTGRA